MDGENNGSKPYEQIDDLGGFQTPYFWVQHPYPQNHSRLRKNSKKSPTGELEEFVKKKINHLEDHPS